MHVYRLVGTRIQEQLGLACAYSSLFLSVLVICTHAYTLFNTLFLVIEFFYYVQKNEPHVTFVCFSFSLFECVRVKQGVI